MTGEGEIVVTGRTHRTQKANREAARARLADLIARAHIVPRKRAKTKPSRAARARRVDDKKAAARSSSRAAKVRLD